MIRQFAKRLSHAVYTSVIVLQKFRSSSFSSILRKTLIRTFPFCVLSPFFANSTNSRRELQFLLLPEKV